jgi:hypothetical protein
VDKLDLTIDQLFVLVVAGQAFKYASILSIGQSDEGHIVIAAITDPQCDFS